MQSFQPSGINQGPKNYVFVDEHNRHKRLKVMRACEGCRKRKIKCDAATTNTWPCAACKRLKLTCVPPVGGVDGEPNLTNPDNLSPASHIPPTSTHHNPSENYSYTQNYDSHVESSHKYPSPYEDTTSQNTFNLQDFHYDSFQQSDFHNFAPPGHSTYPQQRYSSFDSVNGHMPPLSVGSPQSTDSITAEELAEKLGELRVADSGIAPYIRQQNDAQPEAPAPIFDDEENLPALSTKAGSQIRIPPALMPSNEEASKAFREFFEHVHPYVPVLCRNYFYQQWQQERSKISPLLLATVLACAGQVSEEPAGGSQWLALANRHEENFADTPRLSTLQALLLLLKAREKTPKRGYYYRSWVLVKKIVAMAKDLDLHEHYDIHRSGGYCDSTPVECLCKTRIWQTAMMVEIMVGGPQGRSDYGVDLETVDTSPNPPNSDIDDYEKMTSRQFSYWIKNLWNIKGITETYHKLKRKNENWATDPKFVAYNEKFRKWPGEVPTDLQIPISLDGPQVKLPSHFLANMNYHYYLGIVVLIKPQLTASKDFNNDEKWKIYMSTAHDAAKRVCVYQEAILETFDIKGLACMQRGLSFPIYAILACAMVHLIAITSPDPAYNQDAQSYFIRHMRILETCIKEWPMAEVEAQIDGLRAAFSADLNKPFDLRPSFPYGTPSDLSRSSEERSSSESSNQIQPQQNQSIFQTMPPGSHFPTPPLSAGPTSKTYDQQLFVDYAPDQTKHQYHHMPPTSHPHSIVIEPAQWNPTPIIRQFNAAFAIPQSALATPPSSNYSSSPPGSISLQTYHPQIQNQQYVRSPMSAGGYNSTSYASSPGSQSLPHQQAHYSPHPQNLHPPPITTTINHYPQQQLSNPCLDSHLDQSGMHNSTYQPQHEPATRTYNTGSEPSVPEPPVFVTAKEWQHSVARVFDPNGLKRKREFEHQLAPQHQRYGNGNY